MQAQSLESSFNKIADQVKSELRHAPEASSIYLQHWINIYNSSVAQENQSYMKLDVSGTTITHIREGTSVDETDWKPNGTPIISPDWGDRKPISFESGSDLRPPAPPSKTSSKFLRDLEEVFRLGEKYGEFRTADKAVAAAFWADGLGTVTPPGRWNLIALQETRHLPDTDRIRILTALNIALYDGGIAAWDSKFHYKYWRPTTAIISLYPEHKDWKPMLEPPFHPEYVSGHSTFSGAAASILTTLLGHRSFCLSSEELLGLERCFSSFNEAANEAGRSRIYGGIHFDFSNQAGLKLGKNVANQVLVSFADILPARDMSPTHILRDITVSDKP